MKKFIAILSMCLLLFATSVPSAQANKGKAAKKVIELISKGAKKTPKKAAVRETEGYNTGRSRTYRPRHSSYDEDKSSYQPQVYSVQCFQCGGSGAVYVLDYYGNIQYDYYGIPVISQCPSCGGAGSVLVSE